jgi:prophage antirepressor-like protein
MELIKQIDETVSFNEKNIRVIGSYEEPWFVAKDICNILELPNITNAVKILPEKWRGLKLLSTFGGEQNMNIINEAGLYKLIMRSNKPVAQRFQEAVCEDILPSLRKKGEYQIKSILNKYKKLEEEKLKLKKEKIRLEEEKTTLEEVQQLKNLELSKKDKEIKQLHTLVKKKARKRYSYSHSVYIISNPDIKNHYKLGITENRNKRLEQLGPAAPRPYKIEYSRELQNTREEVSFENLLLGIFDKYRVETDTKFGRQREWIKNIKLEVLKNEMDSLVDYYHNRRKYFDNEFISTKNIDNNYEEVEDVEEIDDIEEIDDTEEVEEVEDVDEIDEVDDIEEVNEIDDMEEVEDETNFSQFKMCYVCHEEKSLNDYYDRIENVDGKEGTCKKCYSNNKKVLKQEKDAREIIIRDEGTKKCRTCLEIKEFNNFSKHGVSKDGYSYECIQCKESKNKKIENKRCGKCRTNKNITEYNRFRLGYSTMCKDCDTKDKKVKEDENIKCCSNCKKNLDIDKYNKCKTSYDGYSNYCRDCAKEKKKQFTEKMKVEEKVEIKNKVCSECKVDKDVTNYLSNNQSKDKYSNKCKDCSKKVNINRRMSKII